MINQLLQQLSPHSGALYRQRLRYWLSGCRSRNHCRSSPSRFLSSLSAKTKGKRSARKISLHKRPELPFSNIEKSFFGLILFKDLHRTSKLQDNQPAFVHHFLTNKQSIDVMKKLFFVQLKSCRSLIYFENFQALLLNR